MRLPLALSVCLLLLGVSVRGAVIVETNVVYAQGTVNVHSATGTVDLALDIYRPADPADITGGALVLIHGGSFVTGDRTSLDMIDAAQYFADRGWVCFSIDYRLQGDDPPAPIWIEILGNPLLNAIHAAMVDSKRAVRWVREHVADYGCATNRVAALGHSAGAYVTIQLCISDDDDYANDAGTAVPDQWPGHSGKVNAGVEVSGGVGAGASEFSAGDSPYMIWHGDADGTVLYSEAETNHVKCVEYKIPHRFFTLPGADHGLETWVALHDGRGLKDHANEFLNLFFDLDVVISNASGSLSLSWPSLTNAVYDVRGTANLAVPFTNVIVSTVTSGADTCTATVPGVDAIQYYRIGVHSGQPGYQ